MHSCKVKKRLHVLLAILNQEQCCRTAVRGYRSTGRFPASPGGIPGGIRLWHGCREQLDKRLLDFDANGALAGTSEKSLSRGLSR